MRLFCAADEIHASVQRRKRAADGTRGAIRRVMSRMRSAARETFERRAEVLQRAVAELASRA